MAEVIALINELVARTIRVIMLKQNLNISRHDRNSKMVITLFSLAAQASRKRRAMALFSSVDMKNIPFVEAFTLLYKTA